MLFFFSSRFTCVIYYIILFIMRFNLTSRRTHLNLSAEYYYITFCFYFIFFPDGRDRKTVLRHRPTEPPPQLYGVFVG